MNRPRARVLLHRSPGHSLVEVLIAIAVVAILAGVGLPTFADVMARQTVSTASGNWRDAHALGRSHAILRRVPTVLCPSADGENCETTLAWEGGFLLFEDPNRNRRRDASERVLRVFPEQSRIRMTTSVGRRTVTFQPSGRTDGSNITMTICSLSAAAPEGRRLITSNSGRTRSEPFRCEA